MPTLKHRLLFALIMALVTSAVVSFMVVAVNLGFPATFLAIWLKSFALAYLAVVPMIVLVGPKVQALVMRIFGTPRA